METIQLKNVLPNVFINQQDVQSDIWRRDIKFEKEHLYLIEANSGTGKSSLCSYIFGYRRDYDGQILFDNDDISRYGTSDWTRIRTFNLSLLWQELRLFPELTTMENIMIKNQMTNCQDSRQIELWLDMLGIADKRDVKIGRMSFGQQQRVALIRSLCQPFDFVFVDEPVSHLDETNGRIVGKILTDEARRQGAGVIVTSIGKHIDLPYDNVLRL